MPNIFACMKVAQLAFSLSNRAGGIFEIQVGLSLALKTMGVDVVALGLQDDLTQRDAIRWGGIPTKCLPVYGPRFFGYAKGFDSALENSNPDICHLHTLWMYPGIAMKNWSRRHNRPYMVTPNGMLEPWALANSGWKKKLAGFFYEKAILQGAACLQANTLKEADDFRAYGLRQRIEVIPNGVDLPEFLTTEDTESTEGRKRLLFLGRIHPKKGLVALLKAWADIQNSKFKTHNSKQWQFVIAGWDQGGHEAELKALCAELGLKTAVRTTKDTNFHENIQPRIARIYTDKTEAQGGAWTSQAGAAFSNPSTSQVARDCENTSPTRSASDPAGALFADNGEMGSVGGNQLADSKEFLEGQSQAGLQVDSQKLQSIRMANDTSASKGNSSSVPIRAIRGSHSVELDPGLLTLDSSTTPSAWFGFRLRAYEAWRDLEKFFPEGESEVKNELQAIWKRNWFSGFRFQVSGFMLRKWGGLMNRIFGHRVKGCFRPGKFTSREATLFDNR